MTPYPLALAVTNKSSIRVIWIISAPQPEISDKRMVVSLLLSFVFIPNHPKDVRGPPVGLGFCLCCQVTFYDILLTYLIIGN